MKLYKDGASNLIQWSADTAGNDWYCISGNIPEVFNFPNGSPQENLFREITGDSVVLDSPILIQENKNREMFILNKSRKFSTREYIHLYSIFLIYEKTLFFKTSKKCVQ